MYVFVELSVTSIPVCTCNTYHQKSDGRDSPDCDHIFRGLDFPLFLWFTTLFMPAILPQNTISMLGGGSDNTVCFRVGPPRHVGVERTHDERSVHRTSWRDANSCSTNNCRLLYFWSRIHYSSYSLDCFGCSSPEIY